MTRGKVLIVEDNTDTRQMIKLLLEVSGCEVIEAKDGEAATRLAKEERPNLIIMDLALPDIDGFDATQKIRQTEGISDTPIVVLSAYLTDLDVKQRAMKEGANECLQKPNDIRKLKSVVNKYLSVNQ